LQTSPRFFGRFEHSLDLKGRVVLPARYRSAFAPYAYLTQHRHRCLALWTQEQFDQQLEAMMAMQEAGDDELNLARYLSAGSVEVEIDRQGRLPIPSFMREFASLDGGVLVTGAVNRLELWNPASWAQVVAPSERRLAGVDAGEGT